MKKVNKQQVIEEYFVEFSAGKLTYSEMMEKIQEKCKEINFLQPGEEYLKDKTEVLEEIIPSISADFFFRHQESFNDFKNDLRYILNSGVIILGTDAENLFKNLREEVLALILRDKRLKNEEANGNYQIVLSADLFYKEVVLSNKTIYFDEKYSDELIEAILTAYENESFVTITTGNMYTGETWGDTWDIKGKISLTEGFKGTFYPILITFSEDNYEWAEKSLKTLATYTKNEIISKFDRCGGGLLSSCVALRTGTKKTKIVYKHPTFKSKFDFSTLKLRLVSCLKGESKIELYLNEEVQARFENIQECEEYVQMIKEIQLCDQKINVSGILANCNNLLLIPAEGDREDIYIKEPSFGYKILGIEDDDFFGFIVLDGENLPVKWSIVSGECTMFNTPNSQYNLEFE